MKVLIVSTTLQTPALIGSARHVSIHGAMRGRPMTTNADNELTRFNQSKLNQFEKCPRQFYYRWVEGLKRPPSSALTLGSAVDAGVTHNLQTKIQSGALASAAEVLDSFSTEFDKRRSETDWGDDDPGEQKDLGANLVSAHYLEIAPSIDPAAVQQTFELKPEGRSYTLYGTIDLIEKSGVIADTKTSAKPYAADKVAIDIQPAMYTYAQEALTGVRPEFRYDVLLKTGKTKTQQVRGVVGQQSIDLLFDRLDTMNRAIAAGSFPLSPDLPGNWWCSRRFCGYHDICPKFRGRK